MQNPINTRDATIAALSDAQYVAPMVQSGDLLSGGPKPAASDEDGPGRPTKTFFYVFDYQSKESVYPQVRLYFYIYTINVTAFTKYIMQVYTVLIKIDF